MNICDTTKLIQYAFNNNMFNINININYNTEQSNSDTPMTTMQKNLISLKVSQIDDNDELLTPTDVPTLFQKIANTGTKINEIIKNIQKSQECINIQLINEPQTTKIINLPMLINTTILKKHIQKIKKMKENNKQDVIQQKQQTNPLQTKKKMWCT